MAFRLKIEDHSLIDSYLSVVNGVDIRVGNVDGGALFLVLLLEVGVESDAHVTVKVNWDYLFHLQESIKTYVFDLVPSKSDGNGT